jgi:hypothetical protein
MKKIGIQLDQDIDIIVSNGHLQIGHTLYQNQYLILKAQKGDYKEYPILGVGIDDITNDEDTTEWKRRIREEFERDGLSVNSISIDNGEIKIDADYE